MKLPSWSELKSGRGCPLCAPRPKVSDRHYFVCQLSVSTLYLARDQAYRGTCIAVYDSAHVTRPSELSVNEWQRFTSDTWIVERAIALALQPDHVNLECLGNTVPHLHLVVIPRYRSDPRWGQPVWTTSRDDMPTRLADDPECENLALALRGHIA